MRRLHPRKLLYRSWFYFRVGYGTYVALLLGIVNSLLLIYRLGITYIDFLKDLFPSLTVFSFVALIVAIPLCIGFGLYHMKRTGAYAADASLSTEQNPYAYKAVPGKEQEVLYPVLALTLKGLVKVLDQEPVTEDEKRQFRDAISRTDRLIRGETLERSDGRRVSD